jgi:hypothetical protein
VIADAPDVRGLEGDSVEYDMGLQGLGILLVISIAFGLLAQLVGRSWTHWLWLIGALGWFIGGFIASEVVWGSMTEGDIQPIIDGLAFDESLLGGLIGGAVAVVATWLVTRTGRMHRATPA